MEFDPLSTVLASVHLACKIEEVHEITLAKMLESAGLSEHLSKVAALEVPLLEGIGFDLLVEPKPDSALRMLMEDLRQHLGQRRPAGEGEARDAAVADEVELGLQEPFRDEVLRAAEDLSLVLSIQTDAVLLWPLSIVLAASLQATLEGSIAARGVAGSTLVTALYSALDAGIAAQPQRAALRTMMAEVLACIRGPASSALVTQEEVQESIKAAGCCQKAFEKLHEAQAEQQEAQRKERKLLFRQQLQSAQGGS